MHNQHAGLSQLLATQRITERQERAARSRLAHSAGRSRRRRNRWLTRGWWQLVRWPGAATQPAVGHRPYIRCGSEAPRRAGAHMHLTNHHTEAAAHVPMHRAAARSDPYPDAGTRSPSTPPIGRYQRAPVQVRQADPDAPEVAREVAELIAAKRPGAVAEHVGSTAVPGLAGKGIIDLLLAAEPAHIPTITKALLELGFQHQHPAAFPATRPMLWGAVRHGATEYPVHVHVVPASSPEVAAMRGFRDALRADPVLGRRYAALKRAIVAGGPADPVAFTKAKHDWIAATLAHLGLAADQPRRLYQDDLDPDGPARRSPAAAGAHPWSWLTRPPKIRGFAVCLPLSVPSRPQGRADHEGW